MTFWEIKDHGEVNCSQGTQSAPQRCQPSSQDKVHHFYTVLCMRQCSEPTIKTETSSEIQPHFIELTESNFCLWLGKWQYEISQLIRCW